LNEAYTVPGVDGQKMSKSYGNIVEIFAPPKTIKKKIMSIKTDSTPVEDPKDPTACSVFAMIKLLASPEETKEWEQRYRQGDMGYGEAKKRLVELHEQTFGVLREAREQWASRPDDVEDILAAGAKRARVIAQEVMAEARDACGIVTAR